MRILTILPVLFLLLSVSAQETVSSHACQKVQSLESITLNKLVVCEDLEETGLEETGVITEQDEELVRIKRAGGETRAAIKEVVSGAGKATVKMAKGLVIAIVLAVTGWVSCLGVTCGVAFYHIMKKRRGLEG